MKKIVGVGACVLDNIIEMNAYPIEDSKVKANKISIRGGGPCSTALVCISKLGMSAEYLGVLSKDTVGKFLINDFKRFNVKTHNIVQLENVDPFRAYIVLSKEKATRTCISHNGSIPDDPSLLDFSTIEDADVLHVDGNYINCAKEATKAAKKRKVLVSYDAGSLYPRTMEILNDIDILIASEAFAKSLTGEDDMDKAIVKMNERYHPLVLAITQGSKGGTYIENDVVKHYPSYKVECLDSNGAGDTFHGAFIVAYLNGLPLDKCLRFASATSAIKCQKVGVRDALPTLNEVEQFMKEREE